METVYVREKENLLVIDKKELSHLMSRMREFRRDIEDFLEEMEMLSNKETVRGIEQSLKDVKEGRFQRYKNIGKFKAKFGLR